MRLPPTPLLLAALLSLSQCKKNDLTPEEQLPPETQTGANTFGCLVNGQVWQPGGNDGTSNYSVYYDYSYAQGTLSVATYRLTGNGSDEQIIGLGSDSLRTTGKLRQRLNTIFAPLDKNQVPTAYLEEYGVRLLPLRFFSGATLTDTNRTDMAKLRYLRTTLASARVSGSDTLPDVPALNARLSAASAAGGGAIPLVVQTCSTSRVPACSMTRIAA